MSAMSIFQPAYRPLVKKFRTGQGCYAYDARTSRLLRITPAMYDLLDDREDTVEAEAEVRQKMADRYSQEEIQQAIDILQELIQNQQLLRPGPLDCRQSPLCEEAVARQLRNGADMMTLEVTDACNMRCKYCIFSGDYPGSRTHKANKMSFSVAKAAIDFYRSMRPQANTLPIGFYGGEPLLNFELVKQCCEYVLECERADRLERPVQFSLTTNGTLLSEEKILFFIQQGFALTISLDGPRQIHDQCRVLADGQGTFDIVMRNIQLIYDLDPHYYDDKVLINCVIPLSADFKVLREFFEANSHLFAGKLNPADVSEGNSHFADTHAAYEGREADQEQFEREYCLAHVTGQASQAGFRNSFVRQLLEHPYLLFHRRDISASASDTLNRLNTCFPGSRKIFVDVEGKIHICERVYRQFSIGDVWNGYDTARVTEVFNQFGEYMNSDECKRCWAVRMCPYCFTIGVEGHFWPGLKDGPCLSFQAQLEGLITNYCAILEENPNAFDYMNDYIIS